MAEKRCVFKCGAWNCGSYQFNLYKDDIDQSDLCDVHYWQTKAQRPWVGLNDVDVKNLELTSATSSDVRNISAELKEKNT